MKHLRYKFIRCLLAAGLFFGIVISGMKLCAQDMTEDARSAWMSGYEEMNAADEALKANMALPALRKYENALKIFSGVHHDYPQWNTALLKYRIEYCQKRIEEIRKVNSGNYEFYTKEELGARIAKLNEELQEAKTQSAVLERDLKLSRENLDKARAEAALQASNEENLRILKADRDTLLNQVQRLNTLLNTAKEDLAQAKKDNARVVKLPEIEAQLKSTAQQLADANRDLEVSGRMRSKLQSQLTQEQSVNEQHQKRISQLQEACKTAQEEQKKAAGSLKDVQNEVLRLRGEILRLNEANRKLESRGRKKSENDAPEIGNLKATLQNREEQLSSLRVELLMTKRKLELAENNAGQLSEKLDEAQKRLNTSGIIADDQAALRRYAEQREALEKRLADAQQTIEQQKQLLSRMEKALDAAHKERDEAQNETVNVRKRGERDLKDAEARIALLQEQNDQLKAMGVLNASANVNLSDEQKRRVAEIQKQCEASQKQAATMRAQAEENLSQARKFREEAERLRKENRETLSALQKRTSQAEKEAASALQEKQGAMDRLQKAQQELQRIQETLSQEKKSRRDAETRVEQLERAKQNYVRELSALEQKNVQLENDISNMEVTAAKSDLDSKGARSDLEKKLKEAYSERNAIRSDYDSLCRKLRDAENSLRELSVKMEAESEDESAVRSEKNRKKKGEVAGVFADIKGHLSAMEERYDSLEDFLESQGKSLKKEQKRRERTEQKHSDSGQQIEQLKQQVALGQSEIRRLGDALAEEKQKSLSLMDENQGLKKLQEKIYSLEQDKQRLSDDKKQLEGTQKALKAELEHQKALSSAAAGITKVADETTRRLEDMTEERNHALDDRKSALQRVAMLEKELENEREQLKKLLAQQGLDASSEVWSKRVSELEAKLQEAVKKQGELEVALIKREAEKSRLEEAIHAGESGKALSGSSPALRDDGFLEGIAVNHEALSHADDIIVKGYLRQGVESERAGKLQSAQWNYEQALKMQPENFLALKRLGLIASRAGEDSQAAQYLNKACRLNPDDLEVLQALGFAMMQLNQPKWAMAALSRAIALAPENPQVARLFASALGSMNWHEAATAEFKRALEIAPGDAESAFNLSLLALTRSSELVKLSQTDTQYRDAYLRLAAFVRSQGLAWYRQAVSQGAQQDDVLEKALSEP